MKRSVKSVHYTSWRRIINILVRDQQRSRVLINRGPCCLFNLKIAGSPGEIDPFVFLWFPHATHILIVSSFALFFPIRMNWVGRGIVWKISLLNTVGLVTQATPSSENGSLCIGTEFGGTRGDGTQQSLGQTTERRCWTCCQRCQTPSAR